ncbi:MAG: sulfatase [Candidatus Fermentibacteraceae bacterium]
MSAPGPARRLLRAAGWLLPAALLAAGCGESRPSFLLVVVDALRADHLGCYGYHRDTSPALDSLAGAGVMWTRAQAQAPWTLPAGASILSGLSVRSHRVGQTASHLYGMSPEMPTAATLLSAAGYATAGQVNGYWLGPDFGFHRGFGSFSAYPNGHGRARLAVDEIIDMIGELDPDRPFFAFLHLYDPHSPYHPPSEYGGLWAEDPGGGRFHWDVDHLAGVVRDPENRQRYVNLYDGEIRWTDAQLARLFAWLRETGRAETTVVIVTADHGEEFLDHGWVEHSVTLYQEVLHVPLLAAGPGMPRGVVDSTVVGQIDLLPTMLEMASAEIPRHLEGRPMLPTGSGAGRVMPSSGPTPEHSPSGTVRDRNRVAVRQGDRKLIWDADADSAVMYDLAADSGEMSPLPPDSGLLREAMRHWATPRAFEPVEVEGPEGEEADMLRDLGYI